MSEEQPFDLPRTGEEFQIPKRKTAARLFVAGVEPQDGYVFLAEVGESYAGPERPSDLLRRKRFIAFERADGRFVMVNGRNVLGLTVDADTEFSMESLSTEDLAGDSATKKNLRLQLDSGAELTGTIVYLQPHGAQRVIDFLNQDASEVISLRDEEKAHIVHLNRVATIEIVPDEGPRE